MLAGGADDDAEPFLVDCLGGIEASIFNVLVRLRDYYGVANASKTERERTYIFIVHAKLETAIIVI